ncbi:MAG: hydroxymethylglutaryl-CoA reductase, degradative [Thermoproteota archaeon]
MAELGSTKTSAVSGFYRMNIEERLKFVKEFSGLIDEEVNMLKTSSSLSIELAERMIENVIGTFPMPMGVAVNFLINGRDYLIPMVIEEPSVVAAASYGAKMMRSKGGIFTSSTEPIMIGQIQAVKVRDPYKAKMVILDAKEEILKRANEDHPSLIAAGGGAKDLRVKVIETIRGPMVISELLVDCRDAMGANIVDSMCEAVAPLIERITCGKVYLRIISNFASERLARAWTIVDKNAVGGEEVVDGIIDAYAFAAADPYRAVTHNKGILNGVIAIALATYNDHRAIEAAAHAYAARMGKYAPLSVWEKNEDGDLVGSIEMPMPVGIIGGATRSHPIARIALKILGVKSSRELAEVMVAVGLAQNLAALRALVSEGIQRGHMELHARNIAIMAGATGDLIDIVAERMVKERRIKLERAKELLQEYLGKNDYSLC